MSKALTRSQSIAIDVARGLAAQFVLVGHALSASGYVLPVLLQDLGVFMFFVLSGFLITTSAVSKSDHYLFVDYLIDRASRIFVPLVPAIAFIVLAGLIFRLGGDYAPLTIAINLLALNDFPPARLFLGIELPRVGTGRQLWSITYEWWLYMAAAFVYFGHRVPLWGYLLVIPGLAAVLSMGMLGFIWIVAGCASMLLARADRRMPWFAIAMIIAILAFWRLLVRGGEVYDLEFGLILVALLIAGLLAVERWDWLHVIERPATALAAYSFSLYLTHYTVLALIRGKGMTRVVLIFLVANLLAIAMWWLFERHHRTVAIKLKELYRAMTADRPATLESLVTR